MLSSINLLDGMAIFTEVVNSGSFTKAAHNTGHSTSFISKEINRLEERLGIRLLQRTTRSLSLTSEGEIYFRQCQQIIDDALDAENAISGKQGKPKGLLRVSCPVSFALTRLQGVLGRYCAMYPEIQLDLNLSNRKVDIIADGYDVVIRATAHLEDSSLISRHIMREQSLVLASPAYLAKHGVPKHPHDLIQHKVINYANLSHAQRWTMFDASGERVEVYAPAHITTNNSEMMISLACAGEGIIQTPAFNLKQELATGKLVRLFEDYRLSEVNVFIVYPSRKHVSTKVRSFIDFIVKEFI